MKVFEDERGELVDVYFRFVVIRAGVLPRLTCALTAARPALASNHVTNARLPVALAHVFALLIVEAKLVFVERFDGDFDGALAVGKDDGFVGDDRAEVFADGFLYTILVALLIDDALALQRPVIALDRHKTSIHRLHRFLFTEIDYHVHETFRILLVREMTAVQEDYQ